MADRLGKRINTKIKAYLEACDLADRYCEAHGISEDEAWDLGMFLTAREELRANPSRVNRIEHMREIAACVVKHNSKGDDQ